MKIHLRVNRNPKGILNTKKKPYKVTFLRFVFLNKWEG